MVAAKRQLIQPKFAQQHELDLVKVARLVAHLRAGKSLPPAVVALYGDSALPLDGHHRMEAHAQLGRPVDAWVITGRQFDNLCARHRDAEAHVFCDGVPAMEVAKRWAPLHAR